ncbi:MAG: hypothetical protein KGP13_05180 [Burkholderiales bacterium]|jgi:hypothetical protein|nr:hypothetical protein [Burkholderiales bacterium]
MSSSEADHIVNKGNETFEPAFEAEQLPRLHLPNVPQDATGLSAKDLAQVPTLRDPEASKAPEQAALIPPKLEETPSVSVLDELEALPVLDEIHAQEMPPPVDTWIEVLRKRTEKLTEEIKTLHVRLDVLEKQSKG